MNQKKENSTMTENFQTQKYANKASITKELIEKNTALKVSEFVEQENWNEGTELVRGLIEDELSRDHRDYLEQKLGDLNHLKDKRSNEEYALDLITGWLIEDVFVRILAEDHEVERSSADREREFLGSPDADSDLAVEIDGEKIPLEVTHDNSGFWQRKGIWSTLRDRKFENLREEGALILGLDIENEEIFVLQAEEADKIGKEYNPRINKQASKINLDSVEFHDLGELEDILEEKLN
jgi:hypothetical protein